MQEFLSFKKMITPIIIQALFWIFTVIAVLSGLVMIVHGAGSYGGGGGQVLMGLVWILLGPIVARIYCEILIVIFSINDTLLEIKKNLTK